jgi:hypothetical protein
LTEPERASLRQTASEAIQIRRFGGAIGPSKKIIFPHYGGFAAVVRDG